MATVNLGAIRFNWKGAYNNGTAYVADDVVSSAGSSYICILASTGNAVSNATYWSQMSSAGTNGTDIGTTITTQGDVLYRDGSGLQRLAKGTAAQSLTMNSGATAPEWTTPAGGGAWTLIESTNVTTAQASITISGIDATYATYAIIGEELIPVTDHVHAYIRFGDASGIDSASTDYSWAAERGLHTDGTTSGVTAPIYEKDYTIGQIQLTVSTGNCGNGDEGSEGEGFSFTGQLRGMRGTLMNPMIAGECHYQNNQHISMSSRFVGIRHHHTMAADRVNFLFSSGDIASGRLTVWGIKHT